MKSNDVKQGFIKRISFRFGDLRISYKIGSLVAIMVLLSLISFLVVRNFQSLLTADNNKIEIASRQQMLSQRIAVLSEMVVANVESTRAELIEAVTIYEKSFTSLINGGSVPGHDEMILDSTNKSLLNGTHEEVGKIWLSYSENALQVANLPLLANREVETAYGKEQVIGKNPAVREAIELVRSKAPEINEAEGRMILAFNAISGSNQLLMRNMIVAIFIFNLVVAALVLWIAQRHISKPIKEIASAMDIVSTGDLNVKLPHETGDETGKLSRAARSVIRNLEAGVQFATGIGEGDLEVQYKVAGKNDKLGYSLIKMRDNLITTIRETNQVVVQAGERGELSSRINTDKKEGVWKELGDSINNLLTSVSTPILAVNKIVNAMSEGDLTLRFTDDSQGDILKLSNSLNQALEKLNELLHQIVDNASIVDESSIEMLGASEEMNVNTGEIASAIAQMSSGAQNQVTKVDESSSLVEGILQFSGEMGGKAETINEAAKTGVKNSEKGAGMMKKVVDSMNEISDYSIKTNESMKVLSERSDQISRVLGVITDIASQTNLLALNAAIEAAQAGEAGRGFAVVAEEIRKLAEDSRASAREIEKLIEDVQNDTREAANVIKTMTNSVKAGESASSEASEVFEEISASSKATLQLSEDILNASEVQVKNINQVVSITEAIVIIAEQTAAGTEEVATSSSELSAGMVNYTRKSKRLAEVATVLKNGIGRFTLSDGVNSEITRLMGHPIQKTG